MNVDLQAIGDRQEIAMLLARIAQLADAGDPEQYIDCFTPDAVWDLTDATDLPMDVQTISGRAALLAGVQERRAAGIQGPGSHTRHDVSSITVEVAGDRATARSYFRYYRGTDGIPTLAAMGVYADVFVRGESGWRLHRREISRG
ncbi:nuclear transport factor 2 family protein [Microbacterium sp. AGC62]|uniref:nuclear transport factor 2 family protein n=1 Tax=unclassified Microbacterium TaxID=2609290 RepID=UPI000689FEB8|nr:MULTISPECIES: nuclear transport factor 2 family protein [unclassified Microbacterium]